jgi:hypothetical protein
MAAVRRFLARRRNVAMSTALVGIAAAGTFATSRRAAPPDLPTSVVTRGQFVDTLEIRGEIRPEIGRSRRRCIGRARSSPPRAGRW